MDRWLLLRVKVPAPADAAAVAETLIALGGSAVEERDQVLLTYAPPPPDLEAFLRTARERLRAALAGGPVEIDWSWQPHHDWLQRWKQGLGPRRIGRRLVVTPSWSRPGARRGDVVIVIDPEMAFGTGEHASTRIALRQLEAVLRPGDRVLDVGTGSGILAIAAARLGAAAVLAVESDGQAIQNARDNLERNGVASRVELVHGLVDAGFLARCGPARFDLILANVLSSILRPLLPAFVASLSADGRLVLGGILGQEAGGVTLAAGGTGLRLLHELREEEWWGAVFETGPAIGAAR